MKESFALLARDGQIDEDVFVHAVVIVKIVRAPLVIPNRLAIGGIACEYSRGPFVVAGTQFGIPATRIGGAVENKIKVRIVGQESPDGAAADFPMVGRPTRHAQIF